MCNIFTNFANTAYQLLLECDLEEDNDNLSYFHNVVLENNVKLAKNLIKQGANVNVKSSEEEICPIHYAAANGYLEMAKLLLDNGANPNAVSKSDNMTAILCAAIYNNYDLVKLLLDYKANVNIKSSSIKMSNKKDACKNITLLHTVAASGGPELIKRVINNGADVNAEMVLETKKLTPLHMSLMSNEIESAKVLLQNGAYYDSPLPADFFRQMNLLEACKLLFKGIKEKDITIIELALAQGAFINTRSLRFKAPIIYASWKGYEDIVCYLIMKKADINIFDDNNGTALHYAAKFNHDNIVRILLNEGAIHNAATKTNKTPLDFAVQAENFRTINLLQSITYAFEAIKNCKFNFVNDIEKLKSYNETDFCIVLKAQNKENQTITEALLEYSKKYQDVANFLTHSFETLSTKLK